MKKILFTILAAAAMSAACTKFAEDVVPEYDTVAKPVVEATVAADDSINVVITAGENTSYFGYVVVQGTIEGVTAEKLVANGYAKAANVVVQGEDNAPQSAYYKYPETTADTLALTGLVPFTDYTIYAAAVSPMGVCSEVVALTVKTTDGTEPKVIGFDFAEAENVLTFAVEFSDPVALTGKGTAKAWFYAENYYDESGMLILWKEVDIPADCMSTDGESLMLAVPAAEYIPGAYVAVTYSADIVKNGADATNVAYESHVIGYGSNGIQKQGIFGYYEYANWDLSFVDPATLPDTEEGEGNMDEEEEETEVEPVYFSDWSKLIMTAYSTSEYPLAGKTGNGGVAVEATESNGRSVSYAAKTYGLASESVVAVKLNEAPAYGASISFSIEEGTFYDVFGNENNAFEAEGAYFCSYGYTLADIVGSYAYSAQSAYGYGLQEGTWTIVESDAPQYGNVMFTEMYGTPCLYNVYATFDMVSGTLTIPSLQVYGANDKYLFAFCSSDNSGNIIDVDVVFSVPQAGVINGQSGYFGDAAYDSTTYEPLGFFDVYYGFEAVRSEAAPVAKASARFASKVNSVDKTEVRGQF